MIILWAINAENHVITVGSHSFTMSGVVYESIISQSTKMEQFWYKQILCIRCSWCISWGLQFWSASQGTPILCHTKNPKIAQVSLVGIPLILNASGNHILYAVKPLFLKPLFLKWLLLDYFTWDWPLTNCTCTFMNKALFVFNNR